MRFFKFFFSFSFRSGEFLLGINYIHIVVSRIYDGSHFTDSLSEWHECPMLIQVVRALPTWLLGHQWTSLVKGMLGYWS